MSTRASDTDRGDLVNQLKEAAAEGRLTIAELTERVSEAMDAKTYADLHNCLRELPEYNSYRPWQKVPKSEVHLMPSGMRPQINRRPLRFMVPVVVVVGAFAILTILSGVVASLVLFPIKVVLYVAVLVVIYRGLKTLFRFGRHNR